MKKYVFSIIAILIVTGLTVSVFAQDQNARGMAGRVAGTGAGAVAGARQGRAGVAAQQRQQAIAAIEEQLMILKGRQQLRQELNEEIAQLRSIADSAAGEGATATARLIRNLITQKEQAFQDAVARLGIPAGAGGRGARQGAGGATETTEEVTIEAIPEGVEAVPRGGRGGIGSNIGATSVDDPRGARLETVEGGRASRFGLQQGDIVLSINGQKVTGAESFVELMGSVERGSAVSIQVIRDGEQITVGREAITGGARGARGGTDDTGDELTVDLEELLGGRGGIVSNIGATSVDDPRGARLETVQETGRASRFGLQPGDIVISINGQKVTGAESFEELMGSVERGAAVSIQVIRDGEEITVGREAGRGGGGRRGGNQGTGGGQNTGIRQRITMAF